MSELALLQGHTGDIVPAVAVPEGLRILLVEDEFAEACLVAHLLRQTSPARFEITRVGRNADVLRSLGEDAFDAIVLALEFPNMRGIDTVMEIQQHFPNLPIIVVSETLDENTGLALVGAGAQDYLLKDETDGVRLARAIRYAARRKQAEATLKSLAQYDALTGLANRSLFEDRFARAIARAGRFDTSLALMFLDLDRFKHVNDSLGHGVGDGLLRAVAKRLLTCVREVDTVSRLGGDEFTVLLEEVGHTQGTVQVAEKILEALRVPFSIKGHEIYTTASIGIAMYPGCGDSPAALTRSADAAMYLAKDEGRNGYRFYTEEMDAQVLERLEREWLLRRAIEQREFEIFYQPQVGLRDGHLAGMEALIRWRPPGSEILVPPGEFIPLAEETGLILPIGEWVLHTACLQARAWCDAGLRGCRIAVNLSARQLERGDLVGVVDAVIADTGIAPRMLELELTESMLMKDPEACGDLLAELTAKGVRVSIDDFGTGYCALSYLKHFPIDTLKIDQSFIKNIGDSVDGAITRAIIQLARSLDLRIVAEGVETRDQLRRLRELGPDEVQGFLIGRPSPAASVREMMTGISLGVD